MNTLIGFSNTLATLVIASSMLGCTNKMTFEQFLTRFHQQCPEHYILKALEIPKKRHLVCDCTLKTTQKAYLDMASFLAGIRANDREPRDETDYVPSAIRMAKTACIG